MKNINRKLQEIFKRSFYKIFKLLYGEINGVKSFKDESRVQTLTANFQDDINYTIYKIKKGRLYTDRIQDTAIILDDNIIEGPSFQLRPVNNVEAFKNVVFKKGTPRFKKKLSGVTLSLLTGGAGNDNYWHWMYDSISRIGIIEDNFSLNDFSFFLVPDTKYKFQIETLKLLGIDKKSISSKKYKHIFANNLTATNHPWQHSKSAHKDIENVPKWITFWLREKFLKFKSNKKFYEKIYIDRSDSKFSDRKIINEEKIKKLLIKNKFKILKLSNFSFIEQIGIFNSAKIIVGNHGAGFTNLIFCKKNTKVVEFKDKNTARVISKISKDLGLNYKSILGNRIGRDKKNQNNNLEIPLFKIENLII